MQRGQNDETLVLLTLAGDQSAYEQLVRKYERAVIASARSVTGNLYLAEDVAQDAFITGWMKLDALKDPAKYGAWVCRIAKNCARNTVLRFENYLDLEVVENVRLADTEKDDPAELYRGEIFNITCIDDSEKMRPLYEQMKDKYQCLWFTDIYTGNRWFEILPPRD